MNTSLISTAMEPCVYMSKTTVSDGLGGFMHAWADGMRFNAFVRKESAPDTTVAEQERSNESFTLVVRAGTPLEYHDVFRRLRDGAVFRLTSNVKDGETHAASTVQIARATCERWELT